MRAMISFSKGGVGWPCEMGHLVKLAGTHSPMVFMNQEAKDYFDIYALLWGKDTTELTYAGEQQSYRQSTPPTYITFED